MRRLLFCLVGRHEAALEQTGSSLGLVGDGSLMFVDSACARGDGFGRSVCIPAVERRQHVVALDDRPRPHQDRIDEGRDHLRPHAGLDPRLQRSHVGSRGPVLGRLGTNHGHRLGPRGERDLVGPTFRPPHHEAAQKQNPGHAARDDDRQLRPWRPRIRFWRFVRFSHGFLLRCRSMVRCRARRPHMPSAIARPNAARALAISNTPRASRISASVRRASASASSTLVPSSARKRASACA